MTRLINRFAVFTTKAFGKPIAFVLALIAVLLWAATGPLFNYSDTWQLYANTGTTLITFLAVFLIQATQNREGAAIQAKLDELIRASAASNRFIGLDTLTDEEIEALRERCKRAAEQEPARPDAPMPERANVPLPKWPETWALWWRL